MSVRTAAVAVVKEGTKEVAGYWSPSNWKNERLVRCRLFAIDGSLNVIHGVNRSRCAPDRAAPALTSASALAATAAADVLHWPPLLLEERQLMRRRKTLEAICCSARLCFGHNTISDRPRQTLRARRR